MKQSKNHDLVKGTLNPFIGNFSYNPCIHQLQLAI